MMFLECLKKPKFCVEASAKHYNINNCFCRSFLSKIMIFNLASLGLCMCGVYISFFCKLTLIIKFVFTLNWAVKYAFGPVTTQLSINSNSSLQAKFYKGLSVPPAPHLGFILSSLGLQPSGSDLGRGPRLQLSGHPLWWNGFGIVPLLTVWRETSLVWIYSQQ